MNDDEVEALLATIFELRTPNFLVLSGSLLAGMPSDFYLQVTRRAAAEGIRVLADADGDELRAAVAAGVYLIKPNQYELARLTGHDIDSPEAVRAAATPLVEQGVGAVLCSLGAAGAVLISGDGGWRATPAAGFGGFGRGLGRLAGGGSAHRASRREVVGRGAAPGGGLRHRRRHHARHGAVLPRYDSGAGVTDTG